MQTDTTPATRPPVVLAAGDGARFHFLDNLATVKVAGAGGDLSVVEFLAPRGFGPPLHRHNDEDELFVILDGELSLETQGSAHTAGEGVVAMLPRAVPHRFQVLSETARFLNVTGSSAGAPRFDQMVSTLGIPTDDDSIPDPMDIDPGHVAEVCAAHGIDILGPPPPPLD